jgi:hypothetical protein
MSASRTDFAMRGLAISFLTLARVISLITFLVFFFIGHPFRSASFVPHSVWPV